MERESENSRTNFCQPGEDDAVRTTESICLNCSRPLSRLELASFLSRSEVRSRSRLNKGKDDELRLKEKELRPNKEDERKLRLNRGLSRLGWMSHTRLNDSSISRPRLILKQGNVPDIKGLSRRKARPS